MSIKTTLMASVVLAMTSSFAMAGGLEAVQEEKEPVAEVVSGCLGAECLLLPALGIAAVIALLGDSSTTTTTNAAR